MSSLDSLEMEELLEIQPRELKFTFEVKKQSSCLVHLINKSNEYVAFKVKTTSPKRYCVRPNTGVILPSSPCDIIVTMQAQKIAPPDMQLKDKFLVQSTVAPYGSSDKDLEPSLFSKANDKYIEENKLRVVLISPPHSPVLQPINGALEQEPTTGIPVGKEAPIVNETPIAPVIKETPIATVVKETPLVPVKKETPVAPVVTDTPIAAVVKETSIAPVTKETPIASVVKETHIAAVMKQTPITPVVKETPIVSVVKETPTVPVVEASPIVPLVKENPISKDHTPLSGFYNFPTSNDVEDLTLKVSNLESRLSEADKIIVSLREEKSFAMQERDKLQHELALMRRHVTKVRVGFPFLFVIFTALVGASIGYLLHQ